MFLHLNPQSGLPLYQQMVRQLRLRILGGELAPGTQLPSARELSAELGLNPLTVAKAYEALEGEGLVEVRRGLGTFVRARPDGWSAEEKRRQIAPLVEELVTQAAELGIKPTAVVRAVKEEWRRRSRREAKR
jgi:GntR family transcriptional regulator